MMIVDKLSRRCLVGGAKLTRVSVVFFAAPPTDELKLVPTFPRAKALRIWQKRFSARKSTDPNYRVR